MSVFGNNYENMDIFPVRSLAAGDTCSVSRIIMENHWGTHIDCPGHFFINGAVITDYKPDSWYFTAPYVVNVELIENRLVVPEMLGKIPYHTDLLLIKTGFGSFRGEEKYSFWNPGISAETGDWLRSNYPSLRAIGFDFISLSAYQRREEGRKAHRSFLNPEGIGNPVLIIEDMDLNSDLSGLEKVWVVPLRVFGLDSSPCTVIGVFK